MPIRYTIFFCKIVYCRVRSCIISLRQAGGLSGCVGLREARTKYARRRCAGIINQFFGFRT